MAPTPGQLRAAADVLRRSASLVTDAFGDVGPRSDAETWQGPAADAFRVGLGPVAGRVSSVAEGLRAAAARLDGQADLLRAEMAAAAREADRLRREEECRRCEAGAAGEVRRGIFALGGAPCAVPPTPVPPPAGGGARGGPVAGWPR